MAKTQIWDLNVFTFNTTQACDQVRQSIVYRLWNYLSYYTANLTLLFVTSFIACETADPIHQYSTRAAGPGHNVGIRHVAVHPSPSPLNPTPSPNFSLKIIVLGGTNSICCLEPSSRILDAESSMISMRVNVFTKNRQANPALLIYELL